MNQPNNQVRRAAEVQQVSDAKGLLEIALQELAEDQKAYQRIENNVRIFVERSNYELAALAQVIQQKMQNVETLKKMVAGYIVKPEPPVISNQNAPSQPEPSSASVPAEPPTAEPPTAEVAS